MRAHRRLCLFTAIFLLFFSGCGTKADPLEFPLQLSRPFQAKAVIEYNDLSISALFFKEEGNTFRLEFQEPEILNGMSMLFESDQITISYRDLIGSYRPGSLPQAAVGQMLTESVSLICQGEKVRLDLNGSVLEAEGVLTSKEDSFAATIDPQSGALQTLTIPRQDFQVVFQDFSFQ